MPFPYTQQTWTDGVSSASAARFAVIEAGVALAGVSGTSSTPPGSPADGMIWRPNPQAGVYWLLQYNSSEATHKWVSIGSAAMYSQSDTDGSFNSTTYIDPATTPLASVTIPRAGEYELTWGFRAGMATADIGILGAVKIGSAATSDNEAASIVTPNASGRILTAQRTKMLTFAASDVAKIQYRATAAGVVSLFDHWLFVRPLRIS